jgi:general nucleoside transport system permease protein
MTEQTRVRRLLAGMVIPVCALMVALAVGGALIALVGVSPIEAYKAFFYGIFGNRVNIGNVLSVATPLILCGLGIAFAAQCSVFNIGAEGQLYIGAIFAVVAGLIFKNLPAVALLPIVLLASFLGGGLWGLIPGYLKARYSVNEIVLTVMLSQIAVQLVSWVTRGPMLDPESHGIPQTAQVPEAARLPLLMHGTRLHAGLLIALACAVVTYLVLTRTTFGFRVRAVGFNRLAARYAGIGMVSSISLAMTISGGLAGLAGGIEVAGVQYRLLDGISPGYGFTAIAVSLLADRHPLGVVVSALLFSGLQAGADAMQRRVAVPVTLAMVIQALAVLFLIIGQYLSQHRWPQARQAFMQRFAARLPANPDTKVGSA